MATYPRLHRAVLDHDLDGVRALLARQVDSVDLPEPLEHYTALHVAAKAGQAAMVALLLAHGANPEARSIYDETPVLLAAGYGRLDAVKVLAARGADVTAVQHYGFSPAAGALLSQPPYALPILTVLVAHGAPLNVRDSQETTLLQMASGWADMDAIAFLVAQGRTSRRATVTAKPPCLSRRDGDGRTCAVRCWRRGPTPTRATTSGKNRGTWPRGTPWRFSRAGSMDATTPGARASFSENSRPRVKRCAGRRKRARVRCHGFDRKGGKLLELGRRADESHCQRKNQQKATAWDVGAGALPIPG